MNLLTQDMYCRLVLPTILQQIKNIIFEFESRHKESSLISDYLNT